MLGVDEEVGRPHMFPPGVPEYLVTAMRTAFNETMKDPKFLEDAERLHIEPEPMTGEEIESGDQGRLRRARGCGRHRREALAARCAEGKGGLTAVIRRD